MTVLKLLGPREITFFVPHVSVAQKWYREIFGAPRFSSKDFVLFEGPGIEIGIHTADAKALGAGGQQVLYWGVEDLAEALARMLALGCQVYREPIVGIDGPSVCQVQDPFGNIWGLKQG